MNFVIGHVLQLFSYSKVTIQGLGLSAATLYAVDVVSSDGGKGFTHDNLAYQNGYFFALVVGDRGNELVLIIVQAQHDFMFADTFCIWVHDVVLN